MIYLLAVILPPLGLLLNGQPFAAIFNLILIVPCILLGFIFPGAFLVPSLHAVIAVEPQAPRAGERDRTARPAARVAALIRSRKRRRRSARGEILLVSGTCRQTARIRGEAVLSTCANPKRAAPPRAPGQCP